MSQQFVYTAVNASGETVSGFVEAENRTDLLERLLAKNLYLLRARKNRTSMSSRLRRNQDWALLERLASTMTMLLGSRMSLAESLEVLVSTGDRQLAAVGESLLAQLKSGQSLSQASMAEPTVFGRLYPQLFTLGESTGDMHAVFKEILASVRWQKQLKARVKSLLTYPITALFFMCGVFLFLLVTVVPQLVSFVEAFNQELPWHTQALFTLSRVTQHYWHGVAVMLLTLTAIIITLTCSSEQFRCALDKLLLGVPIVGPLVLRIKLARLFYAIAMLSRSRVDLLTTLDSVKPLLHNTVLEAALLRVRDRVNTGCSLSDAMKDTAVFPESVWRMIRIGERSGDVESVCQHICDLYNNDVNERIKVIEQYLPTLLILVIGLILMWMIVSILGPLYDSVISAGTGLI